MARTKKEGGEGAVEVRILSDYWCDGVLLKSNSVYECDAAQAAALVQNGIADDNADAVKAARA